MWVNYSTCHSLYHVLIKNRHLVTNQHGRVWHNKKTQTLGIDHGCTGYSSGFICHQQHYRWPRQNVSIGIDLPTCSSHLLIEDLPGVGKTTLAHTLAKVLGLDFQRLQFTSDMLPADVLGVSIFNRDDQQFHFHPGPIFSQFILPTEQHKPFRNIGYKSAKLRHHMFRSVMIKRCHP